MREPFKWFKSRPEIIRLAVIRHNRCPLLLRKAEVRRHGCGVDVRPRTVLYG